VIVLGLDANTQLRKAAFTGRVRLSPEQRKNSSVAKLAGSDRMKLVPVFRFAADSLNGSKNDAKSRDLGSGRWVAVAAAGVAASQSGVRIDARVDLNRQG
jgi:hypothetical protein